MSYHLPFFHIVAVVIVNCMRQLQHLQHPQRTNIYTCGIKVRNVARIVLETVTITAIL
ncbi:hypothetical protein QSI_1510 [Clostridioides difficile P28]|nr:hypothetical protein QSI_1510 [Clostridioides difficile P28]